MSIADLAGKRAVKFDDLRWTVEREVRYANITIIEGHGASQYGIGIVAARIAETVAADERAVIPIGSFQKKFGVTLSLPGAVGRRGVIEVFEPDLSQEEQAGLEGSAAMLKAALERVSV
jgi:L-lactate dehydrogenase